MIKIKQAQPKNIDPKQNQKISTIQVNKKDVDEDGDDDGLVQTNKTKKDKKQQYQAPVAIPQQEQLDDKPINLENFGPNQQKSQAKPQVVNEGYTVNKAEFPTLETADQEKISKKKQKELIEANKLKDQQQEQAILTNNGASLFTNSRQGNQPFQQPTQQNTNKLNFSTPIQFSNPKKQELEKIFEQKTKEIVTQQIQRSTVPIAKEETPTPAPIIQFTKSQINLAEKNGAAQPLQAQPAQPAQPTQPKIQRSSITREQMMEQEKLQKQQEQPKPVIQFTNSGKKVQEVQPQNKVEDDDDGWITVEAPGKR